MASESAAPEQGQLYIPLLRPVPAAGAPASQQDHHQQQHKHHQQQQQHQQQPLQHQQQHLQQQDQVEQVVDVKVQALEALNSALCRHIYSTALRHLQQNFSFDNVNQQFMEILEQDDPYDSPCTIAHQDINSCKNRYRDVVPYDHNRVPLPPLASHHSSSNNSSSSAPSMPNSSSISSAGGGSTISSSNSSSSRRAGGTYINASYMGDPSLPGEASLGYIATQGPLPSTVSDLWRMVAVTNTSAIVMLTGLTDGCTSLGNSRPRCAAYFPDQEQDCIRLPGGLTVTCVHKNNLDEEVVFRQLEVVWAGSSQPQQQQQQQQRLWINHYQYGAWPDYGVPSTSSSVLALSHALDGCRRTGCKIVVHCSAGVGRTGTFIAIDMLLQRLHSLTLQLHGSVSDEDIRVAMDIPGLVTQLRKQRRGTVQTAEQYSFIWQAVMDELEMMMVQQQEQEQEQLMLQEAAAAAASARTPHAAGGQQS